SATYGSDAIAGVVNFKLRRRYNGIELGARRGGTLEGDGANTQLTLLAGHDFADDRGSAIVAFEYAERDRIGGDARP
ncbi:hypothetical protein, partial [Acinetobacter baumannii]